MIYWNQEKEHILQVLYYLIQHRQTGGSNEDCKKHKFRYRDASIGVANAYTYPFYYVRYGWQFWWHPNSLLIAAVILITYLAVLCFDLPVYAIFCGAVITFLFVLIFENEGVYLLYYLHSGSSPFFNPDVFTDAVIIVLEMLVVQLPSFALAKLTRLVCKKTKL